MDPPRPLDPPTNGSGSVDSSSRTRKYSQDSYPRKRFRTDSSAMESPLDDIGHKSSSLSQGVTYNFVDNEFIISRSRSWSRVSDPSTQAFITRVPESTAAEVHSAVEAAVSAQVTWRELSMVKRRSLILNLTTALKQSSQRIRHALCVEVGKTLADADAEFERGIDAIETACSVTNGPGGVHFLHQAADVYTIHHPLGVCVSICPFNFPFMIPLWSIPYALLAGNTVILKPSELTPSTSQIVAECALRAGFPPGVFNILHGKMRVVNSLLSEPDVRAINFVGSDIAGERIYEHAQATRKRIQAECNAKNHGVILEDANRAKTLYAIAGSAFGAAGQRCMSVSVVIFVGETKSWVDDLISLSSSLVVGCGLDPLVEVGPLITPAAKSRVEEMIASAAEQGATVALDGRNMEVPDYPDGNFIGPTILTNVRPHMSCYQEEIFGPVLCCIEVDTLDEAIGLINDNRYGNGCSLFTSNPSVAQTFQRAVNVGQVGINVPILAPFGPVMRTANKDSFLGDQNLHGQSPFRFYTMAKTVTSLWHPGG